MYIKSYTNDDFHNTIKHCVALYMQIEVDNHSKNVHTFFISYFPCKKVFTLIIEVPICTMKAKVFLFNTCLCQQ